MSEVRKEIVDIDLDIMEETARELGFSISYDAPVINFGRTMEEKADLVISTRNCQIGFKNQNGDINRIYDSDHKTILNNLMARYKERLIVKRVSRIGWRVKYRNETDRQVILQLVR